MSAQRGIALVIVMVMLASATMIGLSAMHASWLDDKQATSYRAMALAQMASEDAVVGLLANPAHSTISDCAASNDWLAVSTLSTAHPTITLDCRRCEGSEIAHGCLSLGETFKVVEGGSSITRSVNAVILLRSQLVDAARGSIIGSRTLVVSRLTDDKSPASTLRWHSL